MPFNKFNILIDNHIKKFKKTKRKEKKKEEIESSKFNFMKPLTNSHVQTNQTQVNIYLIADKGKSKMKS